MGKKERIAIREAQPWVQKERTRGRKFLIEGHGEVKERSGYNHRVLPVGILLPTKGVRAPPTGPSASCRG